MDISTASSETLQQWESSLSSEFKKIKSENLNLDLTRGKPSVDQLNLSNPLDGILQGNYISPSGVDVRNYGGPEGIVEARQLGANILETPPNNVYALGNSSLTLMHNVASFAMHYGLTGADSAWNRQGSVKFLCPVPGYDRHFAVCQHLGIEMLTADMTAHGPDMDQVEQMLAADSSIKGLWCVPKYSNPTGVVYSDETVARIAKLGKIAGANFRVFWDNAYAIHDFQQPAQQLANIFEASKAANCEDSIIQFASTSKVSFAGAGIAFLAASDNNLAGIKKALSFISIGPDKVNQLRHVKFFENPNALKTHMENHAAIVKPRFDCVLQNLQAAFGDNALGSWETPQGGYFISFNALPGLAKHVVALAAEAGVKLTPAGATFPYGKDPEDKNIRIAPTVPSIEQVNAAMRVFVLCVKLASVRQALQQR